ncbi:MAG TPA: alpha/beta hydrolase [Burkholderiales bacterium]|nr:alpha/beta hydrolase [Burkholderiales bacterium]
MFERFALQTIDADAIAIRTRHCLTPGKPPLLLLHGNPQTHCMWHKIAPRLAERYSVVAPDLTGYGESAKPQTTKDHAPYSKRAMAKTQVALMRKLGFERFFVAGHDRGGRVAYRMAFDHPECVLKLAVLDIVPTWEAYKRADMAFAMGYYHWFFLTQPFDLPERLIGADPEFCWRRFTSREPKGADFFAAEALADYLRCFRNPATIHAICEDYRAGATVDMEIDEADRTAGRKIEAPLLVLWGGKGRLQAWYEDTLAIWRDWAHDVRGRAIDCGHYLPEERPEEVAAEFEKFFMSA